MTGTPTPIPMIRRRNLLRSKTADIFFHIFSVCYENQLSDRGNTDIGHVTKDDAPLDCTDILPHDSLSQEDTSMVETQVVLDSQKDCLSPELAEPDHNIIGETTGPCDVVDTDPSVSFDVIDQDNVMGLMMSSSPPLSTDKDVEEGELEGDLMDLTPEDLIDIQNNDSSTTFVAVAAEDVGRDTTGIANKNTRNLVDYSEIVSGNSTEPAKQATAVTASDSSLGHSGRVPAKRRGPSTEEERACKKVKKLADLTRCPENITAVGEHLEDASREAVNASVNQDAADGKKKKRVVTQERKAKKRRKARIKRAEERIKSGINRPKLEIIVKEKKVSICWHYMNGKCHEGDKCNFSHDSIPLTKSKPCCHFARNSCMKGDDCPYDHQLSKYPCNRLLSTGKCNRGSSCLFSHEAQPNEPASDALNPDSGSKRVDTKSVASNTERNPVDVTPNVFTKPPKGISFLSQKRPPIDSCPSPNLDSEIKETPKTSSLILDPKELAKTPREVPRGINFLSFGKKPADSSGTFSFNVSNGIGKSPLGNLESESSKSDPAVNAVNGVKVDLPTDRSTFSQKPLPMMSFSSTSQKALQSTLAFASKFEARVKTATMDI